MTENDSNKLTQGNQALVPQTLDLMGPTDRFQVASRLYVNLHRHQLLLRKYACDEIDYDQLCDELKCSYAACRVRVFKAKRALRRFFEKHCPELGDYAE